MHDLQQLKIIFYFPRESDAEEHKIDENACVVCQGIEGDKSNPLQAVKKELTVCSCHVTYAFESESTLYSCLNVKELLARSRREI